MNTYDTAHELAKMLRNSDEYRALLQAKQAVDTDEPTKKMIKDFFARQMEIEYEALSGKSEDAAKIEQVRKMYDLIMLNSRARDFVQSHIRFQKIMGDIYKIIGESVAEGLDFFAKG